jgi:hypothetical protein
MVKQSAVTAQTPTFTAPRNNSRPSARKNMIFSVI